MGGDSEPEYVGKLARYIHKEHPGYKVGWYSGRIRIPSVVRKSDFDYIKVGPYIKHLGCLKDRTTNQRLYKKQWEMTLRTLLQCSGKISLDL